MAGRRVPFSHPFFSSDPEEFWSRRYAGMPASSGQMPPEFWSSGFSGPSGQAPQFPPGCQMSQRTHSRREVVSGSGSNPYDSAPNQIWEQYFGGDPVTSGAKDGDKGTVAVSPTATFYIRRPDFQRQSSGSSEVKVDDSIFKVSLEVQQFTPDELDVRVVDGEVHIHAKHEQRKDEHGFVTREFTRRYTLPDDVDPESVKSSLSQEGILSVEAPRKRAKELEGQKIPIEFEAAKTPDEPAVQSEDASASAEAKN